MNVNPEKEALILHEYLTKGFTISDVSSILQLDEKTVRRVVFKYTSNLNIGDEDIS